MTDKNVYNKPVFFKNSKIPKEKILILPPGEQYKIMTSIEKIWTHAFENACDRFSIFVSIGGGVCGDMTGFAASNFMRGVPFIQVPTTLLAMVDASVGGKTGVDTEYGKNSVGSFHQPELVLCCRPFLDTLEEVEIQSGIGEMIKHGMIGSKKHFKALEKIAHPKPKKILDSIFQIVPDSINIKRKVMEVDEKELGVRAHLNLGHTFGHAIEMLSNYSIPHGIAVCMGTLMASNYAIEHGFCDENIADRLENIYHQFGIETFCDYSEEEIYEKMKLDKKVKKGTIRLVLPKSIGEVFIYEL